MVTGTPKADPEKRLTKTVERSIFERLEAICFDLNKIEDRHWMGTIHEGVIQALRDDYNAPPTKSKAADNIPNGTIILIKTMGLLGVHCSADATRPVSQLRKHLTRKFARRGVKVMGVCVRIPAPGEKIPQHVCIEIEVEMNDETREWIQGAREVYYGDPAEGEQSRLWGVQQPQEQWFVRLKGKGLSKFFRTLHHSNPERWTDRACSLLVEDNFHSNDLEAGPMLADATHAEKGKTRAMDFFDPESTYNIPYDTEVKAKAMVEVLVNNSLRLFVGPDEIGTPLYTDITGELRKETVEWGAGKMMQKCDNLYPVSVFPMAV